jgi:hypothetical protein
MAAFARASVLLLAVALAGCGDSMGPSDGAVVTFDVAGESFRVRLETERQVDAARAAQAGGPARIPNGVIVAGADVNTGWSWHLEDVEFAEVTIEVCDGRPSDVEAAGVAFGGGRYCPWSARVIRIEE